MPLRSGTIAPTTGLSSHASWPYHSPPPTVPRRATISPRSVRPRFVPEDGFRTVVGCSFGRFSKIAVQQGDAEVRTQVIHGPSLAVALDQPGRVQQAQLLA